ncbi:T9SS type A sorting domain-containing protein [Rosettibacter firmus]|uniref:T9SS type A sorting domain-containing protein n=1 Tax=Rosettibacter firmus TaxID=3111522 RepID=UPI00336C094B
MKKILVILGILLSISLIEKVYACSCEWYGPFLKVAKGADLVALVKIKSYGSFSGDMPMSMEVEIIELLKGDDTRKTVKVWGDTGLLCRPYLRRFQSDSIWVLALFKSSEGYFRHPDEREGDYNISICGEYYLKIKNDTVIGLIENVNYNDPPQYMSLTNFLTSAKQILTSVEEEIPYFFELSQNYPNPFNPTTKISFSVPKDSHVSLKVFDILGREVAVLANRVFLAGRYELDFNASNLPSGTYIYKLRTEDKTITKKMLLIK